MPKTKHTAEFRGQTFTRTSQNRVYPFMVVTRSSYEYALKQADQDSDSDRRNYRYTAHVAAGQSGQSHRGDVPTEPLGDYYRRKFPSLYNEKRIAEEIAKAQAQLAPYADEDDYVAQKRADRVAKVEKAKADGQYDRFGAAGWCGRPDLAQKLRASEASNPWVAEAHIVETKY